MLWRRVMLALFNVDGVPAAVLDRAGRIARGLRAEVELFSSLYEPEIVQSLPTHDQLEERIAARVDEQHRRLERIADQLREQGLKVRATVRWDYPMFEGVVRQVLRHRPDLLIVPALRGSDVAPRTLAYREARLIETCPCPLLLQKTPETYSPGCIVAAVDPHYSHGKPQMLDEAIIAAAMTIGYALAEPPVRIFHAVGPLPPRSGEAEPGATSPSTQHDSRIASAEARMRAMAFQRDLPGESVHIELGRVETALPAFARDARAQVVVMGAVSRSLPERALLGHTAEKVLDALACDVLVVKPEGFQSPVSQEPAPAVPHTM